MTEIPLLRYRQAIDAISTLDSTVVGVFRYLRRPDGDKIRHPHAVCEAVVCMRGQELGA